MTHAINQMRRSAPRSTGRCRCRAPAHALAVYYIIAPSEASANLARYDGVKYGYSYQDGASMWENMEKTRQYGFGDEVKRRIMIGTYALSAGYYDAYYLKAQKVRTLIRREFDAAFEKYDVLVAPVTPTPAFKIGEKMDDPLADVPERRLHAAGEHRRPARHLRALRLRHGGRRRPPARSASRSSPSPSTRRRCSGSPTPTSSRRTGTGSIRRCDRELPLSLPDIPTPALIVDVPTMERNIRRMAEFFADGPCKLRPHFKAHKTPEIARRQLAAGSCVGLTCATVGEAEVAAGFCDDILIANQVIGLDKCARVGDPGEDRRRHQGRGRLELGLEQMSKAAQDTGTAVGVLVEVNIGFRAGTAPGEPAVALARRRDGHSGRGAARSHGLRGARGRASRNATARRRRARRSTGCCPPRRCSATPDCRPTSSRPAAPGPTT